jgi:hypothetical protein
MFSYVLEKIRSAPFSTNPFRHVYISELFTPAHFAEIVAAPEIQTSGTSDPDLFDRLFDQGYEIIGFPGCILDKDQYIRWHRHKKISRNNRKTNTSCEGFGITLRLMNPQTSILKELLSFLDSEDFNAALAAKFDLAREDVLFDSGLQKYLDGYEISPHPDLRQKAATYMVNINPGPDAETRTHHTHYLVFKDRYKYVQTYWDGHPDHDRCWVPWNWCTTERVQSENNSIVLFSPRNDTMHAVKADYNHLANQRTQLYGNVWYREVTSTAAPQWENLNIDLHPSKFNAAIKAIAPKIVLDRMKGDARVVNVVIDPDAHPGKPAMPYGTGGR